MKQARVSIPKSQAEEISRLIEDGLTQRQVSKLLKLSTSTVSKYSSKKTVPPAEQETKKVGEFDIGEWLDWMETGQGLRKKASWSQHEASIVLGDGKSPVILMCAGDWHVCDWSTDHKLVRSAIAEINDTPNLYVALMGDLIQMAIKMRSVLEVSSNMIPPEHQATFLEKLLEKIIDKVAFSVWCNHGVEREEKQSGISMVKHVLSRKSIYSNGIAHPDLKVGTQTYHVAASHKFRGTSMYDATFANKRYARMEANDRELILMGDIHRFGISEYNEGGMHRVAVTNGSFQTDSGYAKRYFSLRTCPFMPCIVLHHDRHDMVPFRSLDLALRYLGK